MKQDVIWQSFAETGDPLYYLLYKASQEPPRKNGDNKRSGRDKRQGDNPVPQD